MRGSVISPTTGGRFKTVIDGGDRPPASGDRAGRALACREVIGKPIAKQAFAIVDAILFMDERVAELLGSRRD